MAKKERIADLSMTLSAETRDYEAGLKRAADATTRTKGIISQALGGIEKAGLRLGIGLVGAGGAMSMISNEVRHVIDNIEKIPGIPQTTINSINEAKLAMSQTRQEIDLGIAKAIGWASSVARGIGNFAGEMIYGREAAADAERAFAEEASRAAEASNRVAEANRKEAEAAKAAADAQLKHAASVQKFNAMMADYDTAKAERDAALSAYQNLGETEDEKAARYQDDAEELLKKAEAEKIAGQETTESMRLQTEAIKRLHAAQEIRNAGLEKYQAGASDRVQSELESFFGPLDRDSEKFFKNLDESADKARRSAEELSSILQDGFTQAIMEGRDFNDVLDGIGKSLVNMILQQTIIKPLGNWIAGGVSSLFGGFFADGGTLGAGKWGIAGEAGPEVIKGPAEVVPMGKMGGGGNTYYIDARGTDESVVARLGQALKALAGPGVVERRALAAYSDNMRRGGAFA